MRFLPLILTLGCSVGLISEQKPGPANETVADTVDSEDSENSDTDTDSNTDSQENSENPNNGECADQIDNDGDGDVDCDDSDCASAQNCNNPLDADGDGYEDNEDCDPYNRQIHPGATEIVGNGLDDDCNPSTPDTDNGSTGTGTGNGYAQTPGTLCSDTCNFFGGLAGANNGKCEDGGDGDIGSYALSALLGTNVSACALGTDCTDCGGPRVDMDGDGHMPARSGLPLGFFPYFDCNDQDPAVNASATEIPGNNIDEDCDGVAESPGSGSETNCTNGADDDNDGAFDCADPDCSNDIACANSGSCPAGKTEDCNGDCYEVSFLGDGLCDDGARYPSDFNCPAYDYDSGDCSAELLCYAGEMLDCLGKCVMESWLGDGQCDQAPPYYDLSCPEFNNDGGDCP